MKRIITTGILAAIISVGSLFAQSRSEKPVYVIDHQVVYDFDGSQLVNKSIAQYNVDENNNVHVIFTSDFTKSNKIKRTEITSQDGEVNVVSYDAKGNKVVSTKFESNVGLVDKDGITYVVDGKCVPPSEFKTMPSSKIAAMKVIKTKDDSDFKKYAKEGTSTVLIITTK